MKKSIIVPSILVAVLGVLLWNSGTSLGAVVTERYDGDYIITEPNTVIEDRKIIITGSIIIAADNVTLNNVDVKCMPSGPGKPHTKDAIRVEGVNNVKIYNIFITRCGGNGIVVQGGSGHDLSEGKITLVRKEGIVLDGVSNSLVAGWYLRAGVPLITGSMNNRVVSVLVQGNGQGANNSAHPFYISADSEMNQIVRSRTRDNTREAEVVLSENPNNLWHHVICNVPSGYVGCYFSNGFTSEKDWDNGDPAQFSPRSWTVCEKGSFGEKYDCDFKTYQDAVANPAFQDGDLVVLSTLSIAPYIHPAFSVDRPMWIIGDIYGQRGTYNFKPRVGDGEATGVVVTAPNVRLQNIYSDLAAVLAPDTQAVGLKELVNNKWEDAE